MDNLPKAHAPLKALGLALLPFIAAAPVSAATEPGREVMVTIDNFAFTPAEITIKTGASVTFKNQDDIPHSVVGAANAFRSKALDTDQTFSFTFDKPGTFSYFCGLHPHMTGKIVVMP